MQKSFRSLDFPSQREFYALFARHLCDFPSKPGYLLPVGIDHFFAGIRFTPGHFHNQADHKPIVPAVARVAQRAGKYRAALRLPRRVQQKLTRIAVGLRRALLGFTRHQVNRRMPPAAPAMLPDAFSQSGPPPDESAHSESTRQ